MNAYIKLLREEQNFRLLSIVQLICYFGAWFSHTGIFTLLINLDAPIWAITLSAAMAYLPAVILAPFSGVLIDRVSAKPMLIIMMMIETITVFMLVFIDSLDYLWLLLMLIFIRMGTGTITFQAEMSLLPKILSSENLKLANEIHSIIWAVSYTAGMGLAGIYIHFFGIKSAFILDGIIYICSFYFIFELNLPKIAKELTEPSLVMLKNGLKYLKSNPLILHLIVLHGFVGITAYDALVALLADYPYANVLSVSLVIGFINATRSISLMFAPMLLSKFVRKDNLVYFYLGHGIGVLAWAMLQFNFYISLIGILAAGFFTSTLWSYTYTLIQQNCDEKFYGRVIAYNDMFFLSISVITSLAVGYLFKLGINLQLITTLMGAMFFVGAVYYHKIYKAYKL
ncbi:MFS transporter [Campylobacter sp. faydin G-24]|uniref:MFS transporter n=1 Tax=Campylobacter anatolicus TaxID=2829105 RepID=A0ABS5HJC3_9BACT|nr:MFS transporter [Campylobacter anatolicus]MBR8464374.1 MFS transporter [Campylobacter anatolicus]